ncbi:ABC transporter permease [Bordetella sp. 15P40C-2]|uniref:ABC transporter permease n=1 Tax=Bordetella sp. 15P40C-2 TaxID=2572246 RepID=UPI0013280AFA|nr:ABC transporter permease [Bordetella sp. 15P40C-2]MVW71326.1 ABC transporter permease subunit [Bordetella sp. 15P40C-2]
MSATTSTLPPPAGAAVEAAPGSSVLGQLKTTMSAWPAMLAIVLLSLIVFGAIFAPWLGTVDPTLMDPAMRLKKMSAEHWLGTDAFGRDVYSRTLYGARVSLIVGLGAVVASLVVGLALGVVAGYFRRADALIMRVLDGVMAIPGILLAIALVSLSGASLFTVLVAISIPEIPRVARMVRSVILSVRNEPYVEAAISMGTRVPVLMVRHMLPNTYAPLIVQGTYIFAAAILTESILSFLGAGIPPEIPSWGNVMSEGRKYFQMLPGLILYPGLLLSFTVLSVNILGDALRDALDPRFSRRM